MSIIKVHRNGQVTIPTHLRAQVGLLDGDLVEARAHKGEIVLTPKLTANPEYTPAERRVINARLARAETDIKAGRVSKAYSDHSEFIADLHDAAAKLGARKAKRPAK